MHREYPERSTGNRRISHDFRRFEPVQTLPTIDHQLQAGHCDRERQKPGPVEPGMRARRVASQSKPDEAHRDQARRHDHEKHRSPAIGLGDQAAEYRTHDRAHDAAKAPNHHHGRVQRARKCGQDDRLAHWHDQRAEETLSDAENDKRGEAVGEPAQQRAYREAADGAEHDAPPAEPARQPTGRRCRNGGGDQIERHDPGDLIVGRRKRASDLWQDDIGQGDRHAEQQAR